MSVAEPEIGRLFPKEPLPGEHSESRQAVCYLSNEDETQIMTFDQLKQLIEKYCRSFLHLARCNQDVDLAIWAIELLEYFNGPVPEIEILPQANGDPSLFRVRLNPTGKAEDDQPDLSDFSVTLPDRKPLGGPTVKEPVPKQEEDNGDGETVWAVTKWNRHDLEERLLAFGVDPSPENVNKVLATWPCRNIGDFMVEEGWTKIDDGICECFPEARWDGDYEPDF